MALGSQDVLLGKIALGKGYLSRDEACRVVDLLQAGEPFLQGALRLGSLRPSQAQELGEIFELGELVCHGSCGGRSRLAGTVPQALNRCPTCAGPVYLAPGALSQQPVGEETVTDDGEATLEIDQESPEGPAFEPFELEDGLQVLAPIGEGGMGRVYRGRNAEGQVVAIKVLTSATHPPLQARFKREISISSKLNHPQLVRVLGTGSVPAGLVDAGHPYYVMEYVNGRDLGKWLAELRRTPQETAELVRALCGPTNYIHGKGIVHRDIKPANILVKTEGDVPVLCDLGLARYRAGIQVTQPGEILGTPEFMAPEQARGKSTLVGPPTDVYGLGAVLYYLLTGRAPFMAPTAFATLEKVVRQPPRPPRELCPDVPPELERIVLKCLEKEPVARFHTCGELGAALEAAETGSLS